MALRAFQGRVAIVTGAAGGIGLGLTRALVARGCHVAMLDRRADLEDIANAVATREVRVTAHPCNVAQRDAVAAAADDVLAAHGQVDLLINNAGISLAGSFEEAPLDDFFAVMDVNFRGVVHGCAAFLPLLRRRNEAHIVNVCSSFGLLGFAGKTAYSASKFAVRGFSEALRAELSGSGIGVTLLYPGPVETDLLRHGKALQEAQRTAELAFLARRAIPVERVARRTLRAIQRDRARVLLSLDYRLIEALTRISPRLAQLMTRIAAKQMPF